MILASQKCVFDKRGLGYKTSKNEKYFKNYFVKESTSESSSTICNFCGRGGHISSTCPLRNGSQKASTSKLKKTWVEKSKVTNHQAWTKISEKSAEKSFFGEPRKEKCMENSSARKIKKKSGLSVIFRRKIGNFRFIGGKIGREQHALEGALTEGEIAVFSARS